MRVKTAGQIGAVIKDARRLRGWTQAELAEAAGVSRQWIVAAERGKRTIELGSVLATIAALDLDLDIRDPRRPTAPVSTSAPAHTDDMKYDEATLIDVARSTSPLATADATGRNPRR